MTAASRASVLALDIGTSGCKGAVYSRDGRLLAEASAGYPVQRPAPMWVEQLPADWWSASGDVCRRLITVVGAESIAGVGLSGQVPTMVLVGEDGQPLGPAITWQDRRAEVEAAWLREQVGAEQLHIWLGMDLPVDAGWPPARLLWWRRHQSESVAAARAVLMAKDYVLLRLTGTLASDAWSAKGLVHLLNHDAPPDYYARLEVPDRIAPPILAPFAVAGRVTDAAAQATGLPPGTPVVTGMSDALCGMAGTGAFRSPGVAFDLTGTSDIVGCSGAPATAGLLHIPEAVTAGVSVLYGPTQSGGDSLAWFAEWTRTTIDEALAAAGATAPAASEVVFLPYLQGERAPLWDTSARGAFIGLMRQHGLGEGARAVLEGVALAARHILELCGPVARDGVVRLAGGSARSDIWNQVRADVLGRPVEVVEQNHAATLGAAMLAAVGAGLYADLSDAAAMVRIERAFRPAEGVAAHYDRLYARFRALYPAIKHVMAETAGSSGERGL